MSIEKREKVYTLTSDDHQRIKETIDALWRNILTIPYDVIMNATKQNESLSLEHFGAVLLNMHIDTSEDITEDSITVNCGLFSDDSDDEPYYTKDGLITRIGESIEYRNDKYVLYEDDTERYISCLLNTFVIDTYDETISKIRKNWSFGSSDELPKYLKYDRGDGDSDSITYIAITEIDIDVFQGYGGFAKPMPYVIGYEFNKNGIREIRKICEEFHRPYGKNKKVSSYQECTKDEFINQYELALENISRITREAEAQFFRKDT